VWIDYGLEVASALMNGAGNYTALGGFEVHPEPDAIAGVVFSDIRFINEFNKLRDIGGRIIRVRTIIAPPVLLPVVLLVTPPKPSKIQ
jgi:hypothetical protein